MSRIVHLTSLLLQILLFCPETDGAGTITWYEPPPVETTSDTSSIHTKHTQLIGGSTNVKLHWKFSLDTDLKPIQTVELKLNTVQVVNIAPSFNRIEVLSAYKDRFNVTWVNDEKVTLIIFNVTDADAGEFACVVKTLGGETKIWTRKIQVDVVAPPEFTNKSPSPQKVNESSDLQLVCKASGKPSPSITWTKDGSDSVLHTGATWNLTNINDNNAGTYRCTADNGVGSAAQHTIQVIVEFPPRIDLNGTHYVAREGNASLDCQAKGYPPPTITWTPCDTQKNIRCDESFLNASEVLVSRAIYTCKASNGLGDASANTTLIIGGEYINLTLTITGVKCTEQNGQVEYDKPVSDELEAQVGDMYQGDENYLGLDLVDFRCGSLHVDLVLKFKSPVAEDSVLSTFRGAVQNGKLGKLSVNASSIVGIPPVIKSTIMPPTTTPTPKADGIDIVPIVVGVVCGVVVVAIIVAVVLLWRKKKCCNCCATGSKEVSNGEAASPQKSGTSSGTGNNGYVDSGSAYAQPNLPPTKTAGKKEKKPAKKGKDPQPAALPLYAQVDKTKKKPREPENTYDDANDQRRRQPGEVTYTTLDHSDQGASLPRGAANQTTRPAPYTETTYAVLV